MKTRTLTMPLALMCAAFMLSCENTQQETLTGLGNSPQLFGPKNCEPDDPRPSCNGDGGGGTSPADPAIAVVSRGTVDKLLVMNADGSNAAEIVMGEKFSAFFSHPSWSPDGQSIAFKGRPAGQQDGIWVVDVDVVGGTPTGAGLRRIRDRGWDPAWSPLGDEIAFIDCFTTDDTICLMPATGSTATVVYTAPPGHNVRHPDWSPDGSRVVFFESNDATGELALQILDLGTGGTQTVESFTNFFGRFPAWSRDGNQIAYSGYSGSNREAVYLIAAVPDSDPMKLIDGIHPAWSPDGSDLVIVGTSPSRLFTYELATGATTKISRHGSMPDWRRF